jgi:uncharacterized membrane protein
MKRLWLGWLVVAALWAGTAAVFPRLPETLPTHWNLAGEADGWSPKMPGAFLLPLIATSVLVLLPVLRRADPRRGNLERFGEFGLVLNLTVLFMALVHALSLAAAVGVAVDVTGVVLAGLGLFLVGLGNYLPRLRSNWWMGVRTPWTLSSDRVWQRTHRFAGRLMVACGVGLFPIALLPADARGWAVLPVLAVLTAAPVAYSYLAWRRETRGA